MENRFIGISNIAINLLINKWDAGEQNPMVSMQEVEAFMYRLMNFVRKTNGINLIVLPERDWKYYLELEYPEHFTCIENEKDDWLVTTNMTEKKWNDLKNQFKWDLPFYLINAYNELNNHK